MESSGSTEFVPTLNPKWFLTANLPVAIGCILHNIFISHVIFTTCPSKATMDCPAYWQVFNPQKMSYWHRCSISCHKMRGCRKLWKATFQRCKSRLCLFRSFLFNKIPISFHNILLYLDQSWTVCVFSWWFLSCVTSQQNHGALCQLLIESCTHTFTVTDLS